jgi:PRTRC genetic system protein B
MQKEKEVFIPTNILTVYSRGSDRAYYIEASDVINKKGKYVPGPGRPITKEVMRNLINAVFDDRSEKKNCLKDNYIGEHILFFVPETHNRRIVWYRKAMQIQMIFSSKLNIPKAKIWMPAMLFNVSIGHLSIYALTQNKRPTLTTKLCHPPILNLISENKLCWGGVKTKIPEGITIDDEIKLWEDYLWKSEFSHAGAGISTKTDIVKLLRKLGKSGEKFPTDQLLSTNQTLRSILK